MQATRNSSRLIRNVILDFNRKSSDHIESPTSLFVGGTYDPLFHPFLPEVMIFTNLASMQQFK
jgi:hypothetical protein